MFVVLDIDSNYLSIVLRMIWKNIIASLDKSNKLNKDNYGIWHLKIQYILEE